jgi:hypothetical protein
MKLETDKDDLRNFVRGTLFALATAAILLLASYLFA